MRRHSLFYLLLAVLVAFVNEIQGQQVTDELTLEDIYQKGIYQTKGYRAIKWMQDGKGYTTLEANPELPGMDIVLNDATTGERRVLLSADKLIPKDKEIPIDIADYSWSTDQSKLLIFTSTQRVWRLHTRGDYWVFDLTNDDLVQLGHNVERSTMMFAKFSPDANKVAFVSKSNIYVEDLQSREVNQITTDGGGHIINGTFDWVYEEELKCRDGFRWSPDGRDIAYWQSDTRGTGTFYMINNIDSALSHN